MNNTPFLSIRNVSNIYTSRKFGLLGKKEEKNVLKNFDLEMTNSGIFGLTGKSGCGKTTLAYCITGLIDYDGEILFSGDKLNRKLNQVQMVFQNPGLSLNPLKKIGWLIEEPLVIHRFGNTKERLQKVDEIMIQVGLDPSYKSRRVHELSGGQKQRICIARTLILNPSLLIADEAISSLDVSSGAQILNLFSELHETTGLSIFFISHNKDAVNYLCDSIAVMEDGKIFKN